MSLPPAQRRALNQIEKALARDHPGLGPLFGIFTRLTGHEAMPVTERVMAWQWRWQRRRMRRMRSGVATVAGLALAAGVLLTLSLTLPGPQVCAPGTVTAVAVHVRSAPTGRAAGCPAQQNNPGKTPKKGLDAR